MLSVSSTCPRRLMLKMYLTFMEISHCCGFIVESQKSIHHTPAFQRDAADTSLICVGSLHSNDQSLAEDDSCGNHLIFPGGGIFFYWQAGVVTYLREQGYDLSTCQFSGASAGALTATLASTDVDFYEATALALKLAADANVWDRPLGLQGIWGPMIEEWLDTLLPDSIESINGRLSLLITPVPSFGKRKISNFADKKDLIACNMASVHLPCFLDGKLTSDFRGSPHIDGSFLSKATDYLPQDRRGRVLFLNWNKDPQMHSRGGLEFVDALSPDGIWGLIEIGKNYADVMEQQGFFKDLEKHSSTSYLAESVVL